MTTLPSFVELMASLDMVDGSQEQASSPASSPSSSPCPPSIMVPPSPRSASSLSLRSSSRHRDNRYSPYSSTFLCPRRGSLSSMSSSSSGSDLSHIRSDSTSPQPGSNSHLHNWLDNKLSINAYGSASDLAANTPISSYVRRKSPDSSPTLPDFFKEEPIPISTTPFALPTLPLLFSHPAFSESFHLASESNAELSPTGSKPSVRETKSLSDMLEARTNTQRSRRHTGVRISTPPRSAGLGTGHRPTALT